MTANRWTAEGSRSLGPAFWRFWSATALANLGDGIRVAAVPLLAASLTDNPVGVAAVAAAQALPTLVIGLPAGSLADRRGGRTLIAGADIGRVLVLATLVAAVATGRATIPLLAVAAFLLGIGETLRDTAAQTAVPRLVPETLLERANGRLVAGDIVGNEFVGPPVGALLFVAGAALPFAANGASLALAVMLVLSLPLSLTYPVVPAAGAGAAAAKVVPAAGAGVRAGLRWLMGHRMLRCLAVVTAAVAAADSAWFAIFVLYARDMLHMGAMGFGGLLAIGAAGGLLGSFVADRVIARQHHRGALGWSLAVTAGVPVLLVITPHLWAAAAVLVSTSASFAILNVAAASLRQRSVPIGLLGRVTAASRTLVYGAAAAGAFAGGAMASGVGIQAPFLFSGAIALFATAAWLTASRPEAARLA